MSNSPSSPPRSELELYRAVMHRSLTTLRNCAPPRSIPTLTGTEAPPSAHYQPAATQPASTPAFGNRPGKILLVDDEVLLARAYARTLRHQDLECVCVTDAASAVSELRVHDFDVVVCDIGLPDHSGLELLRHVRNSDPDLPMVLVTGSPDLDTAIEAVTLGAFRYLVKPISSAHLLGCIAQARRARQLAQLRDQTLHSHSTSAANDADLSSAFDRALEPLWIAYQPIIAWPHKKVISYQALVRSDEPSLALPSALLNAAQVLGRTQELSAAVQRSVAKTAHALPGRTRILLNIEAEQIVDGSLCSDSSPLSSVASQIALDTADLAIFSGSEHARAGLLERGYQLAFSHRGLNPFPHQELAQLGPQIVKLQLESPLSMASETVKTSLEWCRSQGAQLVVTGVERNDERDALTAAGCELFQDCLFDSPGQ